MVTRVRIEAEGMNQGEVEHDLNEAFSLLCGSRGMPPETEFVEEVLETTITGWGAVHWKGRRVIRFIESVNPPLTSGVKIGEVETPEMWEGTMTADSYRHCLESAREILGRARVGDTHTGQALAHLDWALSQPYDFAAANPVFVSERDSSPPQT